MIPRLWILSWNIRGISLRQPELKDYLKTEPVDVVLLQETLLRQPTDARWRQCQPKFTGFTIYHKYYVRGDTDAHGMAILDMASDMSCCHLLF